MTTARGSRWRSRRAAFSGPIIRLRAQDLAGHEIIGHVPSDGPRPVLEPGRRYVVSWDADAARLLPPAASAPQTSTSTPAATLERRLPKLNPVAEVLP